MSTNKPSIADLQSPYDALFDESTDLTKSILDDDGNDGDPVGFGMAQPTRTRRWPRRTTCMIYGALSLLLLVALSTLISSAVVHHGFLDPTNRVEPTTEQTPLSLGTCGRDVAEAKRRGCVFDIMMVTWVHPQCYDKELSDRYFWKANWTWYADKEGTETVPPEVILEGEWDAVYTDVTFHYKHCMFIWDRQLRMMDKKVVTLDERSRSWPHTIHCLQFVGSPDVSYVAGKTNTKLIRLTDTECVIAPWTPVETIPENLQKGILPPGPV